jgi:AcrR family transcriptional regulator
MGMPRIRAESIALHKAQTRAAILDAAEEALAEKDFDAVSLGVIADLAGLPRSTLYDYFASRETLVAALIEERVPPLVEEWVALLSGTSAVERLEGFFTAIFVMAGRHPKLTSALLGAGRRIPRSLHVEYVPVAERVLEWIRGLVDQGVADGEFSPIDPSALAEALTDLLVGGIDDIVGRDRAQLPVETVIATRLAMMRGGVIGPVVAYIPSGSPT